MKLDDLSRLLQDLTYDATEDLTVKVEVGGRLYETATNYESEVDDAVFVEFDAKKNMVAIVIRALG